MAFYDVGQGLADQAAVESRRHRVLLDVGLDVDVGVADPHQEHDLAHGIGGILALDHGFWHAGELRELVDHAPDVVDLAHDCVGALVEDGSILGDHFAVFAANALRRQLNRR